MQCDCRDTACSILLMARGWSWRALQRAQLPALERRLLLPRVGAWGLEEPRGAGRVVEHECLGFGRGGESAHLRLTSCERPNRAPPPASQPGPTSAASYSAKPSLHYARREDGCHTGRKSTAPWRPDLRHPLSQAASSLSPPVQQRRGCTVAVLRPLPKFARVCTGEQRAVLLRAGRAGRSGGGWCVMRAPVRSGATIQQCRQAFEPHALGIQDTLLPQTPSPPTAHTWL